MSKKQQKNTSQKPSLEYLEEDTVSFFDFMLILARQIKIIIVVPSILCTLTIIYVLFYTEPFYTSTAKIMSSSSSGGGISQAAGLAAQFGITLPTAQSEPQWVYPEIIKSRTLARAMLKRKFDTEIFGPQKTLKVVRKKKNKGGKRI